MTDTTSAAPSEQDLFERVSPMPEGCMRCGDTYAPTEYSAWAVSAFIERFKGWQAARRAQLAKRALPHAGLIGLVRRAGLAGMADEPLDSAGGRRTLTGRRNGR